MTTKYPSDKELIDLGKKAVDRERGELIDNLYRARVLKDFCNVSQSTDELRQMWRDWRP